jgi:putative ABC transport system ATP-binding protein|tara:strand:+ start:467 stop:1165 length:699 start_codon:yes stop_codon:yes gene_type:complete
MVPVSEQNAIDLKQVYLSLEGNAGKIEILHSIDLQITQGSSCALVGPSGSGKSSLLMVMAGLEQATKGRVSVLGQDISSMPENQLAQFRRGQVGVVFQSFHLIHSMTALQNVATALELAGVSDPFGRAAQKLADVGLAHRSNHFPKQLSGGEQQRVALARALASDPKIVFADEPTGNLDAANGASIADILFKLTEAQPDTTLILVTHDAELAARCDRIVNLRDGKVAEGYVS